MKKCHSFIVACILLAISCVSQGPEKINKPINEPVNTETGIKLDIALSDIASYYVKNMPANTKIALVNFDAEAQLLSAYIFEELWIHFEDSKSFILVDRQNLGLIEKELKYQYSGAVSDESMQSIGHQFGPQTLVYGNVTQIGSEYRLVVRATDVEKAVTSIRLATVKTDQRFTGNYHDGEYMTMRIYSEKDAWFKVTHIDVNGNAQVIYPVSPNDNNFIKAGQTRQIPDNTRFKMTRSYGEEMILVGAYEKPFVIQPNLAGPLSNNLLVRGITVEQEDSRTEMRPVATAKFTYSIGP